MKDGQAISLWFGQLTHNGSIDIERFADGKFFITDEKGNTTWLAETPTEKAFRAQMLQNEAEAQKRFRKQAGVPCAMMTLGIEAIAVIHAEHPDIARDDLVALIVVQGIQQSSWMVAATQELIQNVGKFVDYVEGHPDSTPDQIKQQFNSDCLANKLPW